MDEFLGCYNISVDLKGKTVVITGATGGIGVEVVRLLSKEGANLVLISRSEAELQKLVKSLDGGNNVYYSCNLADQKATQKLADELAEQFKTIDVFVAAAGIGVYKTIEEATLEEWNLSFDVNVTANFILVKKLQKSLESAANPLALIIGSGAGVIPMAGRGIYCATKFALRGFALSMAEEFKRTKLQFCLITLGSTLTDFGPLGLEAKKKEALDGKAYFTPEWVGKKLVEIIKNEERETEYTIYPGDYGSGWWKPPAAVK